MDSKITAGRLIAAGTMGTLIGGMVGAGVLISKTLIRLRLRDREFDKTTSKKVKRIQTGEKGRLL